MPGPTAHMLVLRTPCVKALMLMLLGVIGIGIGIKSGQPFWKQSLGWVMVAGCFSAAAVYFFRFFRLLLQKDSHLPYRRPPDSGDDSR